VATEAHPPRISVVIPTYQRREACARAVASALEQEMSPLEVIVCDDGSSDRTEEDLRAWAEAEPRLRYLRLPANTGLLSRVRNLGIESARGDWVAFLDDDDLWQPAKLRIQGERIATGHYDVVASDATRSSGGSYFGLETPHEPDRAEFLRHNPIIVSSAVVRASMLRSAGGFAGSAMGIEITGVEDYALWLTLADRGARFLVLPEDLVTYSDAGPDRMSGAEMRQEARVAAVRWRHWLRRPTDAEVLGSAARGSADAAAWVLRTARRRLGRSGS
jgi:glycosyltransferase involved in cell wall biosynthesis